MPGHHYRWRDPGCAVDIPGFCYSFSFAPNPDFTQVFPPQAEILNYLSTVIKRYHVDQHFTGNVEWTGATWQEKKQIWLVTLQNIQTKELFTQECQILISAVGGLVNPQELKVPGAERFQGEIIHTARWRHENNRLGKIARASVERKSREFVQKTAPERYWGSLIPTYEFGCKRRIFDRGYLNTLCDRKMRLTDDSIVEVKSNSIVTRSGEEVYVDAIIIESQVEMIMGIIRPILLHEASSVEVKASSERQFDVQLHQAIDQTVHSSLCGSYFIDKSSEKNCVPPLRPFSAAENSQVSLIDLTRAETEMSRQVGENIVKGILDGMNVSVGTSCWTADLRMLCCSTAANVRGLMGGPEQSILIEYGHLLQIGPIIPPTFGTGFRCVLNETLGFEKVFFINLPNRPDKRDAITLAASLLQFRPEFIDGVKVDEIDKKAYPSNWDPNYLPGEFGGWRAHINAMQRIVQDRIATAFVLEDDADWDVNLKEQLHAFASASQMVQNASGSSFSPYGSDWDILWIGHCGVKFRAGPVHVTTDDITVVPVSQLPKYWRDYPVGAANNTRLVSRMEEGVCSWGYAVTYLGAQKLLSALSLTPEGAGAQFDVALGRQCQNGWLRCIAPFPSITGIWKPAGPNSRGSDIHSDDGWVEMETPVGSVYSAMYNAHRLLSGEHTVLAALADAVTPELDPAQFVLPEGTLKLLNDAGLHDM
ncbi:hypothetical protein BBP40_006928 [Aspergillus hancockii]|nr:hypothetical protein BBP40_006928 [Aspergillus hancockii]